MRVTLHGLPNQRRTTATNMTLLGNFFPSHFFRFTLCPLGSLLEVQLRLLPLSPDLFSLVQPEEF